GVLVQTKRHSRIVSMLGIRHVVLAINKMDLVSWSQTVFNESDLAYRRFAEALRFESITAIPLSALEGQNVVDRDCDAMPWYQGPSLLQWLETVTADDRDAGRPVSVAVEGGNPPPLPFFWF